MSIERIEEIAAVISNAGADPYWRADWAVQDGWIFIATIDESSGMPQLHKERITDFVARHVVHVD